MSISKKNMFARIWRGIVRANASDDYLHYLRARVIPAYRTADGNQDALIFYDAQREFAVFLILSFWESRAALEKFSDPQLDTNLSRQERGLLLAFESTATVYEIL
mgnify:CR=1 FL=1